MLQKCYNRNNSVTIGFSGVEAVEADCAVAPYGAFTRVGELQAGSCTRAASCYWEEMVNILGDSARIYYADEDLTICIGWQIFPEGEEPHTFHSCDDEDKAFCKLEHYGFRF